jgi:hypothetical protein
MLWLSLQGLLARGTGSSRKRYAQEYCTNQNHSTPSLNAHTCSAHVLQPKLSNMPNLAPSWVSDLISESALVGMCKG